METQIKEKQIQLTSRDALVDLLPAPVPVLRLVETLQVDLVLAEGLLLLLVLLVLFKHLEIDRLVVGVPLLVPEVLVHGLTQDGVVILRQSSLAENPKSGRSRLR